MARVRLTLWNDSGNSIVVTDDDQGASGFVDLGGPKWHFANEASAASVTVLGNYVLGDRVHLLKTTALTGTDQITLDPALPATDGTKVQLKNVDQGFCHCTAAVSFKLNPYGASGAHSRALLFNTGDQWNNDGSDPSIPSLVFYPFDGGKPTDGNPPQQLSNEINLQDYYFYKKTHDLRLDALSAPNGWVRLWDSNGLQYTDIQLPETKINLQNIGWQDRITQLSFSTYKIN